MATDDKSVDLEIAELWPRLVEALFVLWGSVFFGYILWRFTPRWWDGRTLTLIVYGAVAAAVSIWWCSRSWRMKLRIDKHGLTVRNFSGTYRIGWQEVSRFADGSTDSFFDFLGVFWALEIVLRDGYVMTADATGSPGKASPNMLRVIKSVAERYAVPAELTGTAMYRGSPVRTGFYPDPGGKSGWLRYWDGKWSLFIRPETEPLSSRPKEGTVLDKVWLLFPQVEQLWQDTVSRVKRLQEYWRSKEWAPFHRADPASGRPKDRKLHAEVWSPLPGSEDRWKDAGAGARRAGIKMTVWLAATAVALFGEAGLVLWITNNHKHLPSFEGDLLVVFAIVAIALGLGNASDSWRDRRKLKKIDQAAMAASKAADTGESTVSPAMSEAESN